MAQLYPPMIESQLPACYGNSWPIPFQHNRAVGAGQYSGIKMIIKDATTNEEIDAVVAWVDLETPYITSPVSFHINEAIQKKLIVGQFYKVQIAYIGIDQETIGIYSSPGVLKYTAEPILDVQYNNNQIVITYTSSDLTEIPQYYQISLYDGNWKQLETSGKQIYTPSSLIPADQGIRATYALECPLEVRTLEPDGNGTVAVQTYGWVGTVNKLELEEYPTLYPGAYQEIPLDTLCEYNFETGAVNIQGVTGQVYRMNQDNGIIERVNTNDYTVEQGLSYEYRVVPVGKEWYYTASITPDFEHMFLSDESHQLCIRFNPKVSSFKETIQESKISTIGGRFPFTFRNGNVKYKEFSLSGLISYEMDNDELFTTSISHKTLTSTRTSTAAEWGLHEPITPGTRVAMERKFKLEVLEWLNNGKPKLLRSPTEGNYIVRLTNVSLAPNDQLGRMLHTFNAQAYEIAECTQRNIQKYKVGFAGVER